MELPEEASGLPQTRTLIASPSAGGVAAPLLLSALPDDQAHFTPEVQARARIIVQAFCALVLMISCFGSALLILSEAVSGTKKSLFCYLGRHSRLLAPIFCVLPLAAVAILCHLAVVAGLGFIAQFAWRSGRRAWDGSHWYVEEQRATLRANLARWRTVINKVLLVALGVYIFAGPPCAGVARMAFLFLSTGFITLYATMLFFDDEVEQVRMSPRFLRFLGVYTLVGVTYTAYSWGFLERLGSKNALDGRFGASATNASETQLANGNVTEGQVLEAVVAACTAEGRKGLSPERCTVPLDFASGISLWWIASPLFATLLTTPGTARRFLQRWRRRLDWLILVSALLVSHLGGCWVNAPVAFGFVQLAAYAVFALLILRRLYPGVCDTWRGPLEHLVTVSASQAESATFADLVSEEGTSCSICLTDMVGTQTVCRAPCGHDFHLDCLEEWVTQSRTRSVNCPLCRESLDIPDTITC